MSRPFQVGITGGIGSGKSLVSRIFNSLGIPVYDADTHARSLMSTDSILIDQIKSQIPFFEFAVQENLLGENLFLLIGFTVIVFAGLVIIGIRTLLKKKTN